MKLREKLALDARKKYVEMLRPLEHEMAFDYGFLEGFAMARIMAADIVYDSLLNPSDLERQIRRMGQESDK